MAYIPAPQLTLPSPLSCHLEGAAQVYQLGLGILLSSIHNFIEYQHRLRTLCAYG